MKKNSILLLTALLVIAFVVILFRTPTKQPVNVGNNQIIAGKDVSVQFICNANKTIRAVFHLAEATESVNKDEPPVPHGSISLTLSDGRTIDLDEGISADGRRYANPNNSFIFWAKGNGAMVLENNTEKTFAGCVVLAEDPGTLSEIYQNGDLGFAMRYPKGYTLNSAYKYQELGPGKDISGVQFTIPASKAFGTNLSTDSYISIEQIKNTTDCNAALFVDDPGAKATSLDEENGTGYSYITTTGAGAGNRYEETVYAFPGTSPCLALRYFIHYGVFENYPKGSIKEFDSTALHKEFNAIRQTFVFNQ